MQHANPPANTPLNSMTAPQILKTAASQLRLANADAQLPDALVEIANALKAPNGYIVKVGDAALRHDLCGATATSVRAAAIKAGLTPGNFTIEPFVVLRG